MLSFEKHNWIIGIPSIASFLLGGRMVQMRLNASVLRCLPVDPERVTPNSDITSAWSPRPCGGARLEVARSSPGFTRGYFLFVPTGREIRRGRITRLCESLKRQPQISRCTQDDNAS
jgi:hypothetical protein